MTENILLYFSDTGRGHRSATEALQEALEIVAREEFHGKAINIIAEPVAENSHPINRNFVALYNYLLRHRQNLMKYYYLFLHAIRPNESRLGYQLVKNHLQEQLVRCKPSVVVSMHPMTNHYTARAMHDVGLQGEVNFVIVITDPNKDLWRGWACPAADIIIAPNELVKEKLMDWGVKASQIHVCGMPINPEFLKPSTVTRESFLAHLGLTPDLPTLCINAGWAGGGNMLSTYKALAKATTPLQVIFLCGHNAELYEQAKVLAEQSPVPTTVLPFLDSMPDLMSAVDAMVTKAGGLTTFECIAKRLPMILDVITEPMPQERGTVDILCEQGLAKRLHRPEDIVNLVSGLKRTENREEKALPAKYCFNKPEAVFEIARTILKASINGTCDDDISESDFNKTSESQPDRT